MGYLSFQKPRVNSTTTLNISSRPISSSTEQIHLPTAGRIFHDPVGPISSPSVGPTLLAQLMAIVMEFVLSTPIHIRQKYAKIHNAIYSAKNTSSVTCAELLTKLPFTLTGNTAFG